MDLMTQFSQFILIQFHDIEKEVHKVTYRDIQAEVHGVASGIFTTENHTSMNMFSLYNITSKILSSIGSAVSTFIGSNEANKKTPKQTDKQSNIKTLAFNNMNIFLL